MVGLLAVCQISQALFVHMRLWTKQSLVVFLVFLERFVITSSLTLPKSYIRPIKFSSNAPVPSPRTSTNIAVMSTRGGSDQRTQAVTYSGSQKALASWAIFNVVGFIGSAIRRLVPVAIEPVLRNDMTLLQSIVCFFWIATMVYVEGYKSFHLKFSPLVVKRSYVLTESPSILNSLLAGPYAMGLIGADTKRTIVSWSIVAGVMALVKLVKQLPYPW